MHDRPNIDITARQWEIVSAILNKYLPAHEIWAFGSRAKWNAKKYSDLDLVVVSDRMIPLPILAHASDDFSESDLPWKVDLVDFKATSDAFRKLIERDKVVIIKRPAVQSN